MGLTMGIRKKVITVDDSAIILKMIGKLLEGKCDVQAFSEGSRALQYFHATTTTPDLIILDIDMPEVNGFELLKAIKGKDHLKDVPVLFLTSNNDKKHVLKAVAEGANDYAVKPVDTDILLKKINALLN